MTQRPSPITLPMTLIARNAWAFEAEPGGDWPFSYVVLRGLEDKEGDPWRSNILNRADHDTPEGALAEVQAHFSEAVSRCYDPHPVLPMVLGRRDHPEVEPESYVALDALARRLEGHDACCARVKSLSWVETRSGNYITKGGFGFPWPFAYLIERDGKGWRVHDHEAPARPLKAAHLLVEKIHDERIGRLIDGITWRHLKIELDALRPHKVEALAKRILGAAAHEPSCDAESAPTP